MNESIQQVDEATRDELVLWFENTEVLYKRKYDWIKNFDRKIKRGIFNEELAIKGIVYLVKEVMRSYKNEFGLGTVNQATKIAIAKDIFEQDIKRDLSGFNY